MCYGAGSPDAVSPHQSGGYAVQRAVSDITAALDTGGQGRGDHDRGSRGGTAEYDMPEDDKESMPDQYKTVSLEEFVEYSKSMFAYWTEDDFASSFRKMLTIEQFRSEEMQNLYQQYLVSGPAGYVKDLFKNMKIKNSRRLLKIFTVYLLKLRKSSFSTCQL